MTTPVDNDAASTEIASTEIASTETASTEPTKKKPSLLGAWKELPMWFLLLICLVIALSGAHTIIYNYNREKPFKVTHMTFQHEGPWYRKAILTAWENTGGRAFSTYSWDIKHDFWGRTYVIHQLGDRRYLQTVSDGPAIEIPQKNEEKGK